MNKFIITLFVFLLIISNGQLIAQPGRNESLLKNWPKLQAFALSDMIRKNANKTPAEFAVFDADGTIWKNDIEESLLSFMEMKRIITKNKLTKDLIFFPFKKDESLFSYYKRLCSFDIKLGYSWIAQIFSGFTLYELKNQVDSLYAYDRPIKVKLWNEDNIGESEVSPPSIFPAQRELINVLQNNGIDVYIVTASLEELVRMIVSDPKYGYNINPKNVIGVTCLLNDPKTNFYTTARKQIEMGHFYDETYTKNYHYSLSLTSFLWTPATWYIGKLAAIKEYIDPVRRPILVAGDSPNDYWMLFYSNVENSGVRVWVNRNDENMKRTERAIINREKEEKENGITPTANLGWIYVTPEELEK